MAKKRKDKKGRVFKKGECYRSDGRYMYRVTDSKGKRLCVYAKTLDELRQKEEEIAKNIQDGIDYSSGLLTTLDLVNRYLEIKENIRHTTRDSYGVSLQIATKFDIATMKIGRIKISDVKKFILDMKKSGYSYKTILGVRGLLKSAFQMAVDDDMIRKNPFSFKISEVISDDTVHRKALSKEDQERLLDFVKNSSYRHNYNSIIILLRTGLRISELHGLTLDSVNLDSKEIYVTKQYLPIGGGQYGLAPLKSEAGSRVIPLIDDEVFNAFREIVEERSQSINHSAPEEPAFLFLTRTGKPRTAVDFRTGLRRIVNAYNKKHTLPLPNITPHILRHTFCTDMADAGMNVKSLQYLMGHSNADITMNIYAHGSKEAARSEYERAIKMMKNPDTNFDTK